MNQMCLLNLTHHRTLCANRGWCIFCCHFIPVSHFESMTVSATWGDTWKCKTRSLQYPCPIFSPSLKLLLREVCQHSTRVEKQQSRKQTKPWTNEWSTERSTWRMTGWKWWRGTNRSSKPPHGLWEAEGQSSSLCLPVRWPVYLQVTGQILQDYGEQELLPTANSILCSITHW